MFGRKWGLTCATWSCAGASGAEVGPKTGPTWEYGRLSACCIEVQVMLNKGQLGTLWRQLCSKCGPTETRHGEHCSQWRIIDAKNVGNTNENRVLWGFRIGLAMPPFFKPCGPSCGPEPVHLDDAGPIYKCANFQSRALFGGVDPEIAPPAEAVPGWHGPFVSSAPKLSRRCGQISFSTCLKLGSGHRMCVKSLGTPATGMV